MGIILMLFFTSIGFFMGSFLNYPYEKRDMKEELE